MFGFEVLDLLLAADDEGQCGCLHAADAEHLSPFGAVFECVEPRGVHTQQPVADGAAESGLVERLVFVLGLEAVEALADGLLSERGDPQPLDGTAGGGFLHDPSLDELTFLAGIAAVDDAVGFLHEGLYGMELLFVGLVVYQLDAETWRYHGQAAQGPWFPHLGIVVRFLEGAQVSECPGYLITVALHVAVMAAVGSKDFGYLACYARLFGYADYHLIS